MVISPVNPQIRAFYSNITCQAFSPCGKFLIAGNNYCDLYVFELNCLEIADPSSDNYAPVACIQCDNNNQCTSLTTTDRFIIIGTKGKIFGYDWKHLTMGSTRSAQGRQIQPNFVWQMPTKDQQMTNVQVDALLEIDGFIYAGCSDNNIYKFSLEDGGLVKTMSEHTGYIHDMVHLPQNRIASAGEDGDVNIWDLQTSRVIATLQPWKNSKLSRPLLGKWVGCLNASNDWLLCGGGVKAGLWNLPSMQLTTVFDTTDDGHHVGYIVEERVLLGGRNKLHQISLTGSPLNSITTSSSLLFSLAIKNEPKRLISISGNSPYLDICSGLEYRDTILSCFK